MADDFQATEGSGRTFRAKDDGTGRLLSCVHNMPAAADIGVETYRNLDLGSTGQNVKATPGLVYGGEFFNAHATDFRYVKLYDNAGTPTNADTPIRTWLIPPKGGVAFSKAFGIKCTAGIALRAVTGVADNSTGAPSTNDVIVNLDWK